ncbi:hypothetical protein JCGZ_11147 [Jatropha curcas]|uniref:Aminotransferase-like plant mobile domain-containing protein n=1 Tax=Jatropha curcas TaxID=180498 RepID=A0A067KS25_JATCU|nr:hypothetical protein JCGZ_11147 [Jatropha curcas]
MSEENLVGTPMQPRMQGQSLSSSMPALMEQWMDTTYTFHLPFGEMTIPIDFEPTTSQEWVRYQSIISQYEEMPLEQIKTMDVDVVARVFLFYLLSTTLFTNHGNDTALALLPPLQDLDTMSAQGLSGHQSLANFIPTTYSIFVWTQLLVQVPPLAEFDHLQRQRKWIEIKALAQLDGRSTGIVFGEFLIQRLQTKLLLLATRAWPGCIILLHL